jgi:hypothetical protein
MAKAAPLPPFNLVSEQLSYDSCTGDMTWKCSRNGGCVKGAVAGYSSSNGYRYIRLDGRSYMAHRLAWLLAKGCDPGAAQVDHVDGDRSNNRLSNLRLASNAENCKNRKPNKNNTSGRPGVYWHSQAGKWRARIRVNYKAISLGLYDSVEAAAIAREKAEQHYFGEFAPAGNRSYALHPL